MEKRIESAETLGHQIENKVAVFLRNSFDCIESVKQTTNNGPNDKKGVDLVLNFEDGSNLALDVTTDEGYVLRKKIESMKRNPMVGIEQEKNWDGEVILGKSKDLVPRAIIGVKLENWSEYNIEDLGEETLIYMPDGVRIIEEKKILSQLISQIEVLSRESSDYEKSASSIKHIIKAELNLLSELEQEAA